MSTRRPTAYPDLQRGGRVQRARTPRLASLPVALAWVLCASPALACPVCHTELGEQVRGAIFGPTFAVHLLAVLSPFPVLAGLLIALHFACRTQGVGAPSSSEAAARGQRSS
jgi:hypothetical protein